VWLTLCWVRLGQFRRYPMGRRIAAVDPALCDPCVTQSRVGTHWSGAQYPRNTLFKGRNIRELSVGDTSTLHPCRQVRVVHISQGRIVHETYHPRDATSKSRNIQEMHHPRDASSKGCNIRSQHPRDVSSKGRNVHGTHYPGIFVRWHIGREHIVMASKEGI
jgi:hypothetical protein